jgi:hypothetical protein
LRSASYLARSGVTQPLDVHLNIDQHFMKGLRKDDHQAHKTRVADSLLFIISHDGSTERWRSFNARTTAAVILDGIVSCLYFRSFLLLTYFALLDCFRHEHHQWSPDGSLSLLETQPPRLRSVHLKAFDSHFVLGRLGAPAFLGLPCVELGLVDSEPPLHGLWLLLTHNPNIEKLRLNLTRVKPDSSERQYMSFMHASLSRLRELSLKPPHSSQRARRFFRMVNAPNLRHLRLYLHSCFDSFHGVVKSDYQQPIRSLEIAIFQSLYGDKFPLLQHLSTNIRDDWFNELALAYPNVEQLTLLPRYSSGGVSMLSDRPWLLGLNFFKIAECPADAQGLLKAARARSKGT